MTDPSHQPVPANELPVAEGTSKGKQRAADRLNIPSSIVRDAGFAPSDNVFVLDEDPAGAVPKLCLVLLKVKPENPLADYAVAKDCRIRLATAILKKCGMEGANLAIDGGDGRIIVRPAKA
jgi:hypothetical protein